MTMNFEKNITKNESNQNAKAIVDIPVEKINATPDSGDVSNRGDIAELAKETSEHGFSGGIELAEDENGEFNVVTGHGRIKAFESLGVPLMSSDIKPIKNESNQNVKTIVDIPVEKIDINPDNADVFNMSDNAELVKEISEHGFLGGIEVVEDGNGRYEIVNGRRRFAAVKSLGWEKIPCIIYKPMDPITKAKKLISSNSRPINFRTED